MYDSTSSAGGASYQSSHRMGPISTLSEMSETSSRRPFGLSPVAERSGEKGESSDMSSSTTGGGSTVYHARGGGSYGGGSYAGRSSSSPTAALARPGRGGAGGALSSSEDEDTEIMFRAPSPGSVKRPLQPILAQQSHSPMSMSSSFGSRSGSFASPQPRHAIKSHSQDDIPSSERSNVSFFFLEGGVGWGQAGNGWRKKTLFLILIGQLRN